MTEVPDEPDVQAEPRLRLERVPPKVRRAAPLVLIVGLLVVAIATRSAPDGSLPLDPASTEAGGTRALTLILDEVGAEVEVLSAAPTQDFDTLLVLVDNLDGATADAVRRHARNGGVLVVADGGGALTPELRMGRAGGIGIGDLVLERRCDIPALRNADEVDVGLPPMFRLPHDATGCYRDGRLAWLVVQEEGAGTVVATGSPDWLTNRGIPAADNAQLAVALLAPRPGTRVGILRPDLAPADGTGGPGGGTGGTETLADLIPQSVKLAIAQLGVGFALMVLWRARRLGAPVREPQLVRLPGSELVVAVGHLLHRTGSRRRAAELLRGDLLGVLSRRFGSSTGSDPTRLAQAVAAHTGGQHSDVLDVLDGPELVSDEELVHLARRTESLRSAVLVPFSGDNSVDNE